MVYLDHHVFEKGDSCNAEIRHSFDASKSLVAGASAKIQLKCLQRSQRHMNLAEIEIWSEPVLLLQISGSATGIKIDFRCNYTPDCSVSSKIFFKSVWGGAHRNPSPDPSPIQSSFVLDSGIALNSPHSQHVYFLSNRGRAGFKLVGALGQSKWWGPHQGSMAIQNYKKMQLRLPLPLS